MSNFEPGDWNAVCRRCGAQKKASTLRRQWQGYYVCPEHWEPRHPQDFVRAVPDNPGVPWSQPDNLVYGGPVILDYILTESGTRLTAENGTLLTTGS